ncbi:hypothetical protein Vadar_016411 [Vaccinium darrowii]|uniref:Uncharacterized protein n=1 Tax=Vaccinium darrowii TaxID=229202 RepID=A0ACB7YVZ9_9ERIC|nr:hypothetical protein Vadar_016411 [Vaccinium darrowii]
MAASTTPLPEKQPEKIEPTTDSSKTLESPQNPVQQEAATSDPPPVGDDSPKSTEEDQDTTVNEEGEEEEEEGECGFCLFMKGGGCRDSFTDWEKCIEEAEKNNEDIVDKCADITGALKKCMEAHSDYYAPILRAEKAAEEEAVRELEKEKAKESKGSEDAKIEAS